MYLRDLYSFFCNHVLKEICTVFSVMCVQFLSELISKAGQEYMAHFDLHVQVTFCHECI
jgi:hypothetical protein